VVNLDLPGVDVDSIDLTVDRNVLSVHAERKAPSGEDAERIIGERLYGTFSRQLFLGETLDVDHLTASYDDGVLTIEIPVAEQAKARKIAIGRGGGQKTIGAEAAGREKIGRLWGGRQNTNGSSRRRRLPRSPVRDGSRTKKGALTR
jgi:HSP20 family protein